MSEWMLPNDNDEQRVLAGSHASTIFRHTTLGQSEPSVCAGPCDCQQVGALQKRQQFRDAARTIRECISRAVDNREPPARIP